MNQALLDTDTFSEILKAKNSRVVRNARAYRQQFGCYTISVITIIEIVKGFRKRGFLDRIDSFVGSLATEEVLPLTIADSVVAGQIYGELERTGRTIGRADPLIAGIALTRGLTLVTGNTKHFERIVDLGFPLALEDWRS